VEKFVKASNEDGRDFIRSSTTRMTEWHDTEKEVVIPLKRTFGPKHKTHNSPASPEIIAVPGVVNHFVMNLPATAIKFLGCQLTLHN